MKTENLVILLTDIVGYTESTAKLSREENEQLLATHNGLLYPVVKRFGGRIVKTIGDALLIVFRSPTDAMLCAMAMQDTLFAHNQSLPEDKQLHIRVAASLGEVRLENKDIFGEPVNITSRIETITPQDEIYLSDAVYMAMSKAEVPCTEVGPRQLKGIAEPVRIWQIPRFSRPRLVPESVMQSDDIAAFAYPYGGAHLRARGAVNSGGDLSTRNLKIAAFATAGAVVLAAAVYLVAGRSGRADRVGEPQPAGSRPAAGPAQQVPVESEQPARTTAPPRAESESTAREIAPPRAVSDGQAPATGAYTPAVEKLIRDLRSKNVGKKKDAAKVVFKSFSRHPGLLEVVNDELLLGFRLRDDYQHVDTMAWFCNVLGGSGNAGYAETLRQVAAAAPSSKLKRYAEKNLKHLK